MTTELAAAAAAEEAARKIILRRLSRSPQTHSQLREATLRKGIDKDAIDSVLVRLTEVGLVDDTAYAATFLASYRNRPGSSRSWMQRRLMEKGVERELALETVSAITEEDELGSAVALLRRKGIAPEQDQRSRQRNYARLARRGYRSSTIAAALDATSVGDLPESELIQLDHAAGREVDEGG